MKQITDPPRWRIVCEDGTGRGMRVFAPGGEEVTQQVRAVRWEVGPHPQVVAICTLELLAVECDVKAEKPLIARYAYCKEHGDMVPVDSENRHVETLEESVERVFTPSEGAAAIQQNTDALRAGMAPGAIRRGMIGDDPQQMVRAAREGDPALPPPFGSVVVDPSLPPNSFIVASEGHAALAKDGKIVGEAHKCDGCRQWKADCEAVTGRGWRCEGCRG